MRIRLWPATIAGRTFLVLLLGLFAVQVAGLTIHAFDRIELQRLADVRDNFARTATLWRTLLATPSVERAALARAVEMPDGFVASVDSEPRVRRGTLPAGPFEERLSQGLARLGGPPVFRPREVIVGRLGGGMVGVSLLMPDGQWLNIFGRPVPPQPWSSPTFLAALGLMTFAVICLSFWAVRRLTQPIRDLGAAAERLGRDVNAAPLPETGAREVAQAAAAFNTMQERVRRFVGDRTEMLAAIGHDLRTPITRMRLRAEFVDDEALKAKMLADLAEMEAMIASTLAFARDDAAAEPMATLDLAALVRTVADEANDVVAAAEDAAENEAVAVEAPEHLRAQGRPLALKRALTNLVGNAVAYGRSCRVALLPPESGTIRITIDDEGPGIPVNELDRVFAPFHRVERSRSRETGGTGLGLPIARTILRGHGGDVTLQNRREGGLRATITLPA